MSHEEQSTRDELSPTQLIDIDRLCTRFEDAWRSGQGARIEEYLVEVAEPMHAAILRELLTLECELRQARGERPDAAEYRQRFPNHAHVIDAVFPPSAKPSSPSPSATDPGRNLLFGLLAFQNNFIDRDALLGAFTAWVADKTRSLGELLVARGALDAMRHTLIDALVSEHIKMHGGDTEQSLADLSASSSIREDLSRAADPDVEATITHVGANQRPLDTDPDRTPSYAVGTTTSAGQRFRVLRPHARGGLGAVFVALDEELHREVALKEILDHHAHDPSSRGRFVLEAEITGGLEHPGIVPIYGLGAYADGRPYYAMRFIRGDSLREAIAAFHSPLPPGEGGRRPGEGWWRREKRKDPSNSRSLECGSSWFAHFDNDGVVVVGGTWRRARGLGYWGPNQADFSGHRLVSAVGCAPRTRRWFSASKTTRGSSGVDAGLG